MDLRFDYRVPPFIIHVVIIVIASYGVFMRSLCVYCVLPGGTVQPPGGGGDAASEKPGGDKEDVAQLSDAGL